MRARTVERRANDGKLKKVCMECNKVAFENEHRAVDAARKISEHQHRMRHYLGDCGWWHIASDR